MTQNVIYFNFNLTRYVAHSVYFLFYVCIEFFVSYIYVCVEFTT
jgi:hypothetical protein